MNPINEFAVREVLGVKNMEKGATLTAEELSSVVQVIIEDNIASRAICLNPDEALKFSRQLSRIARRIEARNA